MCSSLFYYMIDVDDYMIDVNDYKWVVNDYKVNVNDFDVILNFDFENEYKNLRKPLSSI